MSRPPSPYLRRDMASMPRAVDAEPLLAEARAILRHAQREGREPNDREAAQLDILLNLAERRRR